MMDEKQLTPEQSFQEKIYSKLRDDVGSMMSDEMLSSLVEKAIDKMFFEPQVRHTGLYGHREEEKPSWFVEHITKMFEVETRRIASNWIKASEERLTSLAETVLTEQMPRILAEALFKGIDNSVNNRVLNLEHTLQERIQHNIKNGLV